MNCKLQRGMLKLLVVEEKGWWVLVRGTPLVLVNRFAGHSGEEGRVQFIQASKPESLFAALLGRWDKFGLAPLPVTSVSEVHH